MHICIWQVPWSRVDAETETAGGGTTMGGITSFRCDDDGNLLLRHQQRSFPIRVTSSYIQKLLHSYAHVKLLTCTIREFSFVLRAEDPALTKP